MEKKERFHTDRHASIYRYGVESLYIYIYTVDIDIDLHNTASPRRCVVCMVVVVVVYRWCFKIDERLLENVSVKSFSSSSSSLLSTLSNTAAAAAAPAFLFMYICWMQKGPSFSYPGFICCLFWTCFYRWGLVVSSRHRNPKLGKKCLTSRPL